MRFTVQPEFRAILWLWAHSYRSVSAASSTSHSQSPSSTVSICPSRTINYITETLPQQCLRTNWSRNITSAGVNTTTLLSSAEAGLITIDQPLQLTDSPLPRNTSVVTIVNASPESESEEISTDTTSTSISADNAASPIPQASHDQEQEADPLSDSANFLSFEDWKAQMLKKAGQSVENIVGSREGEVPEQRRRPVGVNQALDSLGDDTEIELDFSGFVNPESMSEALPSAKIGASGSLTPESSNEARLSSRPKEAGTTSKERTNYASFDCAANVLKTNPECKGSTSVLLENKDSYMLNPCSTPNKFLIVELCNDILIDTVALGNYEFFSSTFRTFRVSISDQYPVKLDKWREIGTFEANNVRGVQAFLVENGLIWARYLRIEFLTHYGIEHYCPVSILRVHGKTMIEDYRNDVKGSRADDDIAEEDDVVEGADEVKAEKIAPLSIEPDSNSKKNSDEYTSQPADNSSSTASQTHQDASRDPTHFQDKCPRTNYLSPLIQQVDLVTSSCLSKRRYCNLSLTPRTNFTARAMQPAKVIETPTTVENSPQSVAKPSSATSISTATKSTTQQNLDQKASSQHEVPPSTTVGSDKASISSPSSYATSSSVVNSNGDSPGPIPSRTVVQPPAASPSTQESFFKSVHKRLQLLEANSTLSLQYIEEQSRILREAFAKVEKRQLNKTTTFLESLNSTVLGELREFRLQYDQIWQSTILELSSQREQSQREALALSARLTLLAEEMLWQKRVVYIEFGLILLCLALVVFSRIPVQYLPQESFQSMLQRSSTGFSRNLGFVSPPTTPSRPNSRYGLFSRRPAHFPPEFNDVIRKNLLDAGYESAGYQSAPSLGHRSPDVQSPDYQSPSEDEPDTMTNGDLRVTESPEPPDVTLRRAISTPALGQSREDTDSDGEEDSPDQALPGMKEVELDKALETTGPQHLIEDKNNGPVLNGETSSIEEGLGTIREAATASENSSQTAPGSDRIRSPTKGRKVRVQEVSW